MRSIAGAILVLAAVHMLSVFGQKALMSSGDATVIFGGGGLVLAIVGFIMLFMKDKPSS